MTEIVVNDAVSLVSALNYALTKPDNERVRIVLTTNISLYRITWQFGDKEFVNLEVDGLGYFIEHLAAVGDYASLFGKVYNSSISNVRLRNFNLQANKIAAGLVISAYNSQISNVEISRSSISGDIAAGLCGTTENSVVNVAYVAADCNVAGRYTAAGAVAIAFRNSKIRNIQSDVNLMGESKNTWLGGVVGVAVTAGGQVYIQSCVSDARFPLGHSNADAILARKIP
ncbi:MAG: hypothetical protein QXE80_03585 [Pyrobaculum sp.]